MRIAIVGAGAIGGYVGVRLARAGHEVSFIARGANLEAIHRRGLRLLSSDGGEEVATVAASSRWSELGPQELVILAVKAHHVPEIAADVPALFAADTPVVTMQNGIPYWYFHEHGGALAGRHVESVDPAGTIGAHISPARVIGCVVYPAAELVAPGVVRHVEGDRLPLGELAGGTSARLERVSACFTGAGLKSPVLEDIRAEIWLKLWGNLTFNPISALSRATLADICQYPPTRELARCMMAEAQQVAETLGIRFRLTLEKRIAGAERVGHHKTSMLQDVEAGRAPEIEALVGSVVELGRLTGTPTPHIAAVYALMKLLARGLEAGQSAQRGALAPAVHAEPAGRVPGHA
jgi:2-dehydropantoate 2-reductase